MRMRSSGWSVKIEVMSAFEDLLAEGASAPVDGWGFSWFDGRATEERPSWGYLKTISERMATARAALDVHTGGGEVLAEVPVTPPVLVATEHWRPNVRIAARNLPHAAVVETRGLPFADESFDLVVSRHPTWTDWPEIARVLAPGGTYLSQQVGTGSGRELTEYFLGPQTPDNGRDPSTAVAAAEAAGLTVVDVRAESLKAEFFDIAAVIVYLRKVVWLVPDFSVEKYRDLLERMHASMPFVSHTERFLIEVRK